MITAISLALLLSIANPNSAATISIDTFASYEDAQLTAGRQAYADKKYEQAVTILKAYVDKKPKDYEGHLYLGMSYRGLNRFDDSIAALEKAVALKSKSSQAHFQLGETCLAMKNYEMAVKEYQWLQKKEKWMAAEFRLHFPAEVATQYQLPPSPLEQQQADLDAAQPILPSVLGLYPTILYREKAEYTEAARNQKINGLVILKIVFSRQGKLIVISVVRGLPCGLTESAIIAARKIRFTPAMKDGLPVSVSANIEFSFALY